MARAAAVGLAEPGEPALSPPARPAMDRPPNMPPVPAEAGPSKEAIALSGFLAEAGLEAYGTALAELGVEGIGALRERTAGAALGELAGLVGMPRGHVVKLRRALERLQLADEAGAGAGAGAPAPKAAPAPEPEPAPAAADARPQAEGAGPAVASSSRLADASAQLVELEAAASDHSKLHDVALSHLQRTLDQTHAQLADSRVPMFDPELVQEFSAAAADHIAAVKTRGRDQMAAMASQLAELDGDRDTIEPLIAQFTEVQAELEQRWQADEATLAEQWRLQQQSSAEQKAEALRKRRAARADSWAGYFERTARQRCFRLWYTWASARAELAKEGVGEAKHLLATGSGKRGGQKASSETPTRQMQIALAAQKQALVKARAASRDDRMAAARLRKTVEILQQELSSATNASVVAHEMAKRMHKRHATERKLTAADDTSALSSSRREESFLATQSVNLLRSKLRAVAIDDDGQPNAAKVLKAFGKRSIWRLEPEEWRDLVRNGAAFSEFDLPERDLKKLFKQIDLNADGRLSAEELHAFLFVVEPDGEWEMQEAFVTVKRKFQAASYVSGGQDYARLFNQINADRSGEMTFEQFRAAVRRHGESPPAA